MGIIADVKAGPVADANTITDHALDRVRDLSVELTQQFGPAGAALANRLLQVFDQLEDHAADRIEAAVPQVLDQLTGYELVFRVRKIA